MKIRGFEVVSAYRGKGIRLPQRKTARSAGYDIESAEDCTLEPGKIALVPTGLKAYMQADEYLGIHIRSSLAVKQALTLANGQGIIDADYYNNESNEGHILVALINQGKEIVQITKGARIAQGIFYRYLIADGDRAGEGEIRTGGFGSTTK